jgi:hypothetical protein
MKTIFYASTAPQQDLDAARIFNPKGQMTAAMDVLLMRWQGFLLY